jgi:hypothetical protein
MNYRKTITWISCTFALLCFQGCPYGASVPLQGTPVRMDERLLGRWGNENGNVVFAALDNYNYLMLYENCKQGHCTPEADSTKFAYDQVSAVQVNGVTIIQHKDHDDDGITYMFFRYQITGNRLVLRLVSDTLFENRTPFRDSAALTRFISRHLSDPALFDPEDVLTLVRVR